MDSYSDFKFSFIFAARPSFHNYVAVMFVFSVITLFAYGLAEIDAGLNNW